jgi:4-amino-4-deoxy-L-arabinose transferase-like glycosyltransferase
MPKPFYRMKGPVRAACIGAVAGALASLPGLGVGTLWDNSETAYGEVAREILFANNWIVMHLNGHPWFVQPPLYFWIAALCAKVFGLTAFALRLPSALATIAMSGALAYAVAKHAGMRAGIFASIVLATSLMQAVIGRLAIMDALLDLFVMVAIFWWFRALHTGEDLFYGFGSAAIALGFLAKGLVAPVVALLIIVPYAWWSRKHEEIRLPSRRAWLYGIAAFVIISAPWYVALASQAGVASLAQLVGHYTFGRYTGVIENQSGPVWYYVPVLILGFFPWIAFVLPAIFYGIERIRSDRLWRFAFVWMIVPLVFFSFAQTKLPNYVALELPGMALATGLYFDAVARKGASRSAIVAAAIVPVTIGALAVAIRIYSIDNRLTSAVAQGVPALLGAAFAIFAGSLVTALLLMRRKTVAAAPYALTLATVAALDVLAVAVLPHAEAFKPIPKLAQTIDRERRPGDVVAIENVSGSNALVFYTRPGVVMLAPPGAPHQEGTHEPRRVICGSRRVWVVEPRNQSGEDPSYGRDRREVEVYAKAALFLYSGPTCSHELERE